LYLGNLEKEDLMKLHSGLVCLLVLLLIGCGARFQPLVEHRVFDGPTKEKVFNAVVRAVHSQDFLIAAADKESGIIATDWHEFAIEGIGFDDKRFRLRINLLVFEEAPSNIAVTFKSVTQYYDEGEWIGLRIGERMDSEGYRRLTQILDDFFLEVQRYAGPSVQRR
jgi:hypothetical protein